MKKIVWFVIVLLGLWMLKLSVDIYTIDKKYINDVNSLALQQNQKIASLNDQLIALQQLTQTEHSSSKNTVVATPNVDININDHKSYERLIIKDRLSLIHVLIQQHQFTVAIEQIQKLKQKLIEEPSLPESVNIALIEALSRDQNMISLYLQQSAEHQAMLQQELQQLDSLLNPATLTTKDDQWKFSSWLNISKAQGIPDFQNREFVYQEQKLKLLLAQQALYSGQLNFYYSQLKQIQSELVPFPDAASKQLVKRLNKIENKQIIAPPTLSALALLEGE